MLFPSVCACVWDLWRESGEEARDLYPPYNISNPPTKRCAHASRCMLLHLKSCNFFSLRMPFVIIWKHTLRNHVKCEFIKAATISRVLIYFTFFQFDQDSGEGWKNSISRGKFAVSDEQRIREKEGNGGKCVLFIWTIHCSRTIGAWRIRDFYVCCS